MRTDPHCSAVYRCNRTDCHTPSSVRDQGQSTDMHVVYLPFSLRIGFDTHALENFRITFSSILRRHVSKPTIESRKVVEAGSAPAMNGPSRVGEVLPLPKDL